MLYYIRTCTLSESSVRSCFTGAQACSDSSSSLWLLLSESSVSSLGLQIRTGAPFLRFAGKVEGGDTDGRTLRAGTAGLDDTKVLSPRLSSYNHITFQCHMRDQCREQWNVSRPLLFFSFTNVSTKAIVVVVKA